MPDQPNAGATMSQSQDQSWIQNFSVPEVTKEEEEAARWDTARTFQEKSGEDAVFDSLYGKDYASLDLKGLCDALASDGHSQSTLFKDMLAAVKRFLEASEHKGKVTGQDGTKVVVDYINTLQETRRAVNQYLYTRSRQFHVRDSGKRRLDITERIQVLLNKLTAETEQRIGQLSEEKQRRLGYRQAGLDATKVEEAEKLVRMDQNALDILTVLRTHEFGPASAEGEEEEEEAEREKEWLQGGFTEELKQLLKQGGFIGDTEEKKVAGTEKKQRFLAFMMEKKNRLMVNKMTATIMVDAEHELTLDMPWLKTDLLQYLGTAISKTDFLSLETDAMERVVKEKFTEYKNTHQADLKKAKDLRDELIRILGLSGIQADYKTLQALYAHPKAEAVYRSADVKAALKEYEDKLPQKKKLIEELLAKEYSKATRGPLMEKLSSQMPALRIFGDEEHIRNVMEVFMRELVYRAPELYQAERRLDQLMDRYKVQKDLRDSFVDYLTGNDAEKFVEMKADACKSKAAEFAKRLRANEKAFSEKIPADEKLTAETWEELEKLRKRMGGLVPTQVRNQMELILNRQSSAEKITREEYLTRRIFETEDERQFRKDREAKEAERIREVSGACSDIFPMLLRKDKDYPLAHFRKTEEIYRAPAEAKKQKKSKKDPQMLLEEARKAELKALFKAQRMEDKYTLYEGKLQDLISRILDTGEGLHQDVIRENERKNLEAFGVKSWAEALQRLNTYLPDIKEDKVPAEMQKAEERYNTALSAIEAYDNGAFKEIAEILMGIPEVQAVAKSGNAEKLKELLDGTIKTQFTPVMEAIRQYTDTTKEEYLESYGIALCKQYVYTYREKIFAGGIPADGHAEYLQRFRQRFDNSRIKANLKKAEAAIIDDLKKERKVAGITGRFRLKAEEDAQIRMMQYVMQTEAVTTDLFEKLLDPEEAVKRARAIWRNKEMLQLKDANAATPERKEIQRKRFDRTQKPRLLDQDVIGLMKGPEGETVEQKQERLKKMLAARKKSWEVRKEVGDKINRGRAARMDCLGMDILALHEVREGKSLIRARDLGAEAVTLDKALTAKVRGALIQQVSTLPQELPQVLKDALIEEASCDSLFYTSDFIQRHRYHASHGKLYRHADVMQQLYDLLIHAAEDEMSEEEAQMFIVHLYGQREVRDRLFDAKDSKRGKKIDMDTIRASEDYKSFRANYKKLKEFEALSFPSEPSLAQEHADMARDLRILLITNIGLNKKDAKGKPVLFHKLKKDEERKEHFDAIGAAIEKQRRYLEYSAVITEQIREQVRDFYKEKDEGKAQKTPQSLMDKEVRALREYYMAQVVTKFEQDYSAALEEQRQQAAAPQQAQPAAQQQTRGAAQSAAQPEDPLLKRIDRAGWAAAIRKDYRPEKDDADANPYLRKELLYHQTGISLADVEKRESERVAVAFNDESLLAGAIHASATVFTGMEKQYQKLDVDQKKFFALALVMMDTSALGENTQGTAALLTQKDKKQEAADAASAEIQKYVEGKEYHIEVDYWEARAKLIDYADPSLLESGYQVKINVDAFNKAMAFARKLFSERQAHQSGELDTERMGDAYSSILSAFLYGGKTQQNEIDKLNGVKLSKEDVLSRLIAYAEQDQVSKAKVAAGAAFAVTGTAMMVGGGIASDVHMAQAKKAAADAAKKEAEDAGEEATDEALQEAQESAQRTDTQEGVDAAVGVAGYGVTRIGAKLTKEPVERYHKMSGILRRLKKLNDEPDQLRILLILLQNRTLLDKSVTDPEQFVSQDERDVLFNALSGEATETGESMSGFDTDEACHQALASAMSFQLRDDMFFKGKEITADHFAEGALQRTTTIDWDLLDRAFEFMDAVRDRRATILATSHASDYIHLSGNTAAIRELNALEGEYKDKKAQFTQEEIEKKLKAQVDSAMTALVTEDVEVQRAWDGYLALTPQEKSLFFKVLQHRDLLDISKKDYVGSFFGVSDRNYLNPAGRSELLNEFIRSSLGEGLGVQLDEDAYYEAMRSLLSTQVSDLVDFTDKKDLSGKVTGIFSYERFLFMGRGTAIDWKLFKRALNFVNRAAAELRTQEGNALMYQGAGDLEANGMIDVDYSFLRRNFHKTGNQWSRFAARLALKRVKKEVKFDETLDLLVGAANAVTAGLERAGFQDYGIGKGMAKVSGALNRAQEISGMVGSDSIFVGFEDTRTREEQEEKDAEEEAAKQKEEEDKHKTEAQLKAEKEAEEAAKAKAEAEAQAEEEQRRKDLMFLGQMKEGFDLILQNKQDIQAAFMDMRTFMSEQIARYLGAGPELVEAEADESNVVTQKVGAHVDAEHGDARDTLEQVVPKAMEIRDFWLHLDEIPFASNLKKLMVYGIERAVYRSVLDGDFMDQQIYHDEDGNEVELTRDQEVEQLREHATKFVREKVEVLAESVFGKEGVEALKSVETEIFNCQGYINDALGYYTKYFTYAKSCVAHTESIVESAVKIRKLKVGKAAAKERKAEDDARLQEAEDSGRLSEKQRQKAKGALEHNRAMTGLSEELATAVQAFGIAEEAVNMAFETVNTFAGTLNYGAAIASKAVQDGLEFVMFAARVLTDRKALQDYYFTTADGQAALAKLQKGMQDPNHSRHAAETRANMGKMLTDYSFMNIAGNADMLDIIADMQGYEHTSELVEDVGMHMAQSLVFSASKFNPMIQTRMMAVTVMLVMGLEKDEIGDTSPETVQKLFESFKMAR